MLTIAALTYATNSNKKTLSGFYDNRKLYCDPFHAITSCPWHRSYANYSKAHNTLHHVDSYVKAVQEENTTQQHT